MLFERKLQFGPRQGQDLPDGRTSDWPDVSAEETLVGETPEEVVPNVQGAKRRILFVYSAD
jgi:hypothetical protein